MNQRSGTIKENVGSVWALLGFAHNRSAAALHEGVDMPDIQSSAKSESCFAALLTLFFLFVGGFTIFHHEMWRDEVQAWMIARDSGSLHNLFYNLRYDGHPSLWYLLMYPISRLTHQPYAMQILHILLAAGAAYILARYSPFTRSQRAILAFGYFPFYEYGIISRNYAVGLALLFVFCAMFPRRSTMLPLLAVVLGLMANASAYGCLIALTLSMSLFVAWWQDRNAGIRWAISRWRVMASVMIVGIGVLFAIQVMKPAPDSGVYAQWFFGLSIPRLVGVLTAIGSSYTLFPEVLTQWHMEPSGTIIRLSQALFGVILFTYFALVFSRRPVALVTYLLSIIAFAVLMYCKHPGTLRHHGHIFVMLVVSMWLFNYTKDRPLKRISVNKIADWCTRHVTSVFMALLVISLAGGIIMSVRDIMTPFSRGKDVARFIVSNGLSNMPILADRDAPCSTVSAYLDVPVYYAADGRWGTYMVFDNQRAWRLTSNQLVDRSARLANEKHGDILVVLNYKMSPDVRIALKAQSIRVFNGAMVGDENYWLYRIKYPVHAQREKFADHS